VLEKANQTGLMNSNKTSGRTITVLLASSLLAALLLGVKTTTKGQIDSGLEKRIRDLITASGAEVGVAFHDEATGHEVLINADTTFHAASTMKVPVMMEVFRQAQEKKIALDEPVIVKNRFKSIVDGSEYSLSPDDDSDKSLYARVGQASTIRELLRIMITVSSNLATNILIERVTADRVMDLMHSLGASNIRVLRGVEDAKAFARGLNNTTTARDLMVILQAIAEHRAVTPAASDQMIEILLDQAFNEGIPAQLPAATRVAHKTGSITRSYHDAAIVFPPKSNAYVLVVLTRGLDDESHAHRLVADISAEVFAAQAPRH
jgi:beta-lactamase class A